MVFDFVRPICSQEKLEILQRMPANVRFVVDVEADRYAAAGSVAAFGLLAYSTIK
ncbi:unnamed protein product [marine sediment metagenome]|uniref:Uncharacterized protein n=1 Tax=marine sediment metagenome TaxID=412755 RepID=X1QBV8_9ZZZZ